MVIDVKVLALFVREHPVSSTLVFEGIVTAEPAAGT